MMSIYSLDMRASACMVEKGPSECGHYQKYIAWSVAIPHTQCNNLRLARIAIEHTENYGSYCHKIGVKRKRLKAVKDLLFHSLQFLKDPSLPPPLPAYLARST